MKTVKIGILVAIFSFFQMYLSMAAETEERELNTSPVYNGSFSLHAVNTSLGGKIHGILIGKNSVAEINDNVIAEITTEGEVLCYGEKIGFWEKNSVVRITDKICRILENVSYEEQIRLYDSVVSP